MLHLVPTPIGNLSDMTFRAVEVLKAADFILAEDTRTSSVLLAHYGIRTPLSPYHRHNEHRITEHILTQLREGRRVALLSDAGTPGISDPAFLLVRACVQQGLPLECLPGPTAFVPALVASGLPTDRFCFEGFLPLKKGRHSRLKVLSLEPRTMVFYESPQRLVKTLGQMMDYFGADRPCCVSREISKKFEEHQRGPLQEVQANFQSSGVKGEVVLLVGGCPAARKTREVEPEDSEDAEASASNDHV